MTAAAGRMVSITRPLNVTLPTEGLPAPIGANFFQFAQVGDDIMLYASIIDPHLVTETLRLAHEASPESLEPVPFRRVLSRAFC
jgi:hypothetical protein